MGGSCGCERGRQGKRTRKGPEQAVRRLFISRPPACDRVRVILPLAILLLVPLVGALPLPALPEDLAGDEFLTAPPLLFRADPPAQMPPGVCHAPAVDIVGMDVARGAEAFVVSLTVADLASRSFSCTDLADAIGEPGYSVEVYGGTLTGMGGDLQLLLHDGPSYMRCWGYVPGFFFPITCDYAVDGNTMTWSIAAEHVDGLDVDGRALARAEAPVGDLWMQDVAE